ncbi:lethal giant larvae like, C-terminal-domain-containing protein [Multifurca ochricompacta]|uniref:Lethal giant larvae like, C-terminal-domain-containing protein n=1 Tax=Multifurca ochricompacta TaxID=376703 RepID=A0AAD4MDC8_9AGAM|nr:lethal giant larvae like, C-terminal-domain-containing protein [Multifurca ochricompacta]
MFKSIARSLPDLSADLRERDDWNVGSLRTLDHLLNIATFSIDPVSSILAVGTIDGTIRIFGAPGVETNLSLPSPALSSSCNSLRTCSSYSVSVSITCITACIRSRALSLSWHEDGNDKLYLWDLTPHGQMKLEASMRFDRPITCITLSPSHTHAFVGLESGEVKTYDLLCRRVSAYVITNAWEIYENNLIAGGMLVDIEGTSRIPIDVVVHPRHLNFVFVAYGGGIALLDLKERKTLRTYELLIPAGAPGGSGYADPPQCFFSSVHPAGHFFAVGHVDGSIAFWAVEDHEQPLMVRTLDEIDVHKVDGEKLEQFLSDEEDSAKESSQLREPREPIFKLSWSETSLVILGGQFSHDPPGINVLWLPSFNPPAPSSPVTNQQLHPSFRDAMRESLDPLSAYFYRTAGITQDFLLMPRDSPHFSGTWNPTAILMLSESGNHIRTIEAQHFPPLEFLASAHEATHTAEQSKENDGDGHEALVHDLATTLQSMTVNEEPKKLHLPPSLWSGPDAVVDANLFPLDRIAYETLSGVTGPGSDDLPLEGGIAVPDEEVAGAIKYAKFEPHRIVVTRNADLSIRFLDVSVQLLIPTPPSPFTSAFPRVLPRLTIDVLALSGSPEVAAHLPSNFADRTRIDDVQLAVESLEIALVLSGGEVLVYRIADRQSVTARQLPDKHLVSLEHVPVTDGLRFQPYFLVKSEGPVTAFAMSDVGFAAAAYANGSLSVIDMRGPRVMLHVAKAQQTTHRHSFMHRNLSSADPVANLAWTICGVRADPTPQIRLVAIRASGLIQIYTLVRGSGGVWSIPPAPSFEAEGIPAPLAGGTFILDAYTGAPCKADKAHLTVALESKIPADSSEEGVRCLLLVVGAKGARCLADFGDDRVARVEWGMKAGNVVRAQVVERNGSYALVVFTDRHEIFVYSLPMLEHLHTLPLPTASSISSVPSVRAASPTPSNASTTARAIFAATSAPGVVPLSPAKCLCLDSLFNIRRGYHIPLVSLTERKDGTQRPAPPAPTPVSLGPADWRSWLVAGPDRPVPEKSVPRGSQAGYSEWGAGSSKAAEAAASTARTKNNLYDRLRTAVVERGEMLGDLETSVNSLEQGSKNMLAQAKMLAAKQTTKSWLPKF